MSRIQAERVRPARRRVWRGVARGLAVLLLAAGGAVVLWGWSSLPRVDGTMRLPGLANAVEVFRDEAGVPHIFALNEADALFALGYVHAQDRLWQMEFTRRLGAGRLAELAGPAALEADRFMRSIGLYRAAERQAAALDGEVAAAFAAYAAGVNAWLASAPASLPPEFALLRHRPEPWRVADSIVWGRLLAYRLSGNWRGELYRARLAKRLEPARIAELWPGDAAEGPVTLDAARRAAALDAGRLAGLVPPSLSGASASNAWVLAGARSATGAPLLANDPHLGFSMPGPWYLVRIVTPGWQATGASAPGTPFVLLGHNGHVAWGMTSTGGDTQDLFVETPDPADPARYLTPAGSLPFATRRETIAVKGAAPVELLLRETRHGPVISDLLGDRGAAAGDGAVLALADAALAGDDRTVEALHAMQRARDADEFERAAAGFGAPLVNILFADTQGATGIVTPGRVPLRRAGDGRYPVDGASGDHDWTGFVPAAAMPRLRDPAAGLIVNANNRLVGADYPYAIARDWDAPYRAQRIHEALDGVARAGLKDNFRLQHDKVSLAARDLLPRMLAALGDAAADTPNHGSTVSQLSHPPDPARAPDPAGGAAETLSRVVSELSAWDHRMDPARAEPLLYAAWLRHAVRRIAGDELGEDFDGYWRPRPRFVASVLEDGQHWCGGDCAGPLRLALADAMAELEGLLGPDRDAWRWDSLHRARFDHAMLGEVPVVGRLFNRSIATGGGDNTVGRGTTAGRGADPYAHVHGAGYRAVYDLGDLGNSRFMIPGGQSGNPLSPHYDDLLARWRDGDYIRIDGNAAQFAATGLRRLALLPAAE